MTQIELCGLIGGLSNFFKIKKIVDYNDPWCAACQRYLKKNPHISSYTSYHPEEEKTPETKQQNTKKSHN